MAVPTCVYCGLGWHRWNEPCLVEKDGYHKLNAEQEKQRRRDVASPDPNPSPTGATTTEGSE